MALPPAYGQPMKVTLEITVESVEEYLQVLAVLDHADRDGKLDFKFAAGPSARSLSLIAEDAIHRMGNASSGNQVRKDAVQLRGQTRQGKSSLYCPASVSSITCAYC